MFICNNGFFYYNEEHTVFPHTTVYRGNSIGLYPEGIYYEIYRVYLKNIKILVEV